MKIPPIGRFCIRLIMLAFVALHVAGLHAADPADPAKPTAGAAPPKPGAEPAPPPSLPEILTAMEALDAGERRTRLLLADQNRLAVLNEQIDEAEKTFSKTRQLIGDVLVDIAGFHELVDLGSNLRTTDQRLSAVTEELAAKAKALDTALDRATATGKRAAMWLETARARGAPPAILERIEAVSPRSEALARDLRTRRDQVLEVLSRAGQLRSTVQMARAEIGDRREQLAAGLRSARAEPIWALGPEPEEWARARQFFDAQLGQGLRHVRDHAARLAAIAVLAFLFTWWLIGATRAALEAQAEGDMGRTHALFRMPLVCATIAALLALSNFGPQGPLNYQLTLLALFTLAATFLVRAVVGKWISLSLYTLAAVMMSLFLFGALFDPLPLAGRLLLVVHCLALAGALGADLARGRFEQAFPAAPIAVRWTVMVMILLLALAVPAAVGGAWGAARVLRNGVLGAMGAALLLAVQAVLVFGLALALMQTKAGRSLRMVRLRRESLLAGLRRLLVVTAVVAWAIAVVLAVGRLDDFVRFLDTVYRAEISIGSANIELSGVWIGIAVIVGTIVLVKIVKPLLEVEFLPRMTARPGLPFAISAVTRYLLVTAGVLLAMAAMGIDLTRVTLLAGALGVGIGFGLQGVVNNFVCGLILLLERPLNVGDVVQVGQLRGRVQRIGVRSSTVRTPQGAEVIVPNADLISKDVTNWTLSDRRRRLEVEVGVADTAEPDEVVRLLEAAAKDVPDVLAGPTPSASFVAFAEGCLNFRLQVWVDDYDRGSETESALRVAILKKFRAAGIPLPPRDPRSGSGAPTP